MVSKQDASKPVVHVSFMKEMNYSTSAIFWFGKVTSEENYADVREGYDQDRVWVHLEIFDRRLWYDPNPTPSEFSQWNAVSLYLDVSGSSSGEISKRAYREGMLAWWESRSEFQQAYYWNEQS